MDNWYALAIFALFLMGTQRFLYPETYSLISVLAAQQGPLFPGVVSEKA